MKSANVKMVRVSSLTSPLTQALFGVSFMINLIYGSSLVKQGVITLGDFVAFNGYLTMIMRPVISIGRVINIFQRGMASYKRLNEIFEVKPAEKNIYKVSTAQRLDGNLEIKNLTFSYPNAEEPAIKNINLQLDKGKVLGIMGKTGSGKTTLINVLLRLYDIDKDRVFFDGKDINDIPVDILRESIGCVPQDNFLFSATIDDNIRFFSDEYSDEDVENAAKMSLIYQSIMDFPEKFETLVGERGVNLSGGQKQRISIARAIIKNPSILILDDSLSAVDTKTEESILENLKEVLDERTGIIIANRVSAVKNADEIIIMDSGRIVERGTHNELVDKKGIYFDLYQEQIEKGKKVEYVG
jgi:ATP-binding cassette subfamily B protein